MLSVCDRKFDIVLAIDGTGNEKDFGYLKGAIVQLLDRLIMGEDKVKVGVVLLGNTDGLQIPISGNRVELEDQVARLGLPEDSNRYDIGMLYSTTHMIFGMLYSPFLYMYFFVHVYYYFNYKVAYLFVFLYLTLILSIEMVPF